MRAAAATRSRREAENLVEWRQRMLAAFTRLHDRAAQRAAADEIARDIDELDSATLPVFMAMLLDSCSARKVSLCHESFRLIAITAAAHGEALRPFVSRIVAVAIRALKEPEATALARETIAEAIGMVARHVPPPPGEDAHVLGLFLRPLFALLAEQDKGYQTGAILAISAIIANSKLEHVQQDTPRMVQRMMERLCKPGTQVHGLIFGALGRLAEVVGETFIPYVPQLMPLTVTCMDCPDWVVRKASADLLCVLVQRLGPPMQLFRAEMQKTLTEHRFDRVPPVREAIALALRAIDGTMADASGSSNRAGASTIEPKASTMGRARALASSTKISKTRQQQLARTVAAVSMRPATTTRVATEAEKEETSAAMRPPRAATSGGEEVKPWRQSKQQRQQRAQEILQRQRQEQGVVDGPSMGDDVDRVMVAQIRPRKQAEDDLGDVESPLQEAEPDTGDVIPEPLDVVATESASPMQQEEEEEDVFTETTERPVARHGRARMAWGADRTVEFQVDQASIDRQIAEEAEEEKQHEPSAEKKPRQHGSLSLSATASASPKRREELSASANAKEIAALRLTIAELQKSQETTKAEFEASMKSKDEELASMWSTIRRLEQQVVALLSKPAVPKSPSTIAPSPSMSTSMSSKKKPAITPTSQKRTTWEQAVAMLGRAGETEAAFRKVLQVNDIEMLLRLMEMTGPAVLDGLSNDVRAELFNQVTPHLLDTSRAVAVLPWVEQMLDLPPLPEGHVQALCAVLEQAAETPSPVRMTATRLL